MWGCEDDAFNIENQHPSRGRGRARHHLRRLRPTSIIFISSCPSAANAEEYYGVLLVSFKSQMLRVKTLATKHMSWQRANCRILRCGNFMLARPATYILSNKHLPCARALPKQDHTRSTHMLFGPLGSSMAENSWGLLC
jgi:hypothetical protein